MTVLNNVSGVNSVAMAYVVNVRQPMIISMTSIGLDRLRYNRQLIKIEKEGNSKHQVLRNNIMINLENKNRKDKNLSFKYWKRKENELKSKEKVMRRDKVKIK